MKKENGSALSEKQVTDIVKQKQRRPKRSEEYLPKYEPGDMSRMITDAMNLSNFGPVDINDPDAVEQRVNQALTYMIQHDMKPTVESLALAFNTNRMQLWRWTNNVECGNIPERSRYAIKKAYSIMNQLLTQTMADGKINPVAAIFLLKNNHQYKDQTDVVVTPNNPYQAASDEELKDKYLTDIPSDE